MAHQIRLRRRAYADIDEHFGFISTRMGTTFAARWRNRLIGCMDSLTEHPERYSLAHESAELEIELREMLFGRRHHMYRTLFTIDGQTVDIHRVRHAAQNQLKPGDV